MNREAVDAMRCFLSNLGIDEVAYGMEKTPERVAEMYAELFSGIEKDCDSVWGDLLPSGTKGMVAVRSIPFYSMCEHHLLPFFGTVDIVYLPRDGMVAGFGKFAEVVDIISHRPQLQERMTEAIAEAVFKGLNARGALVRVEAVQLCMVMRGRRSNGSKTVTMSGLGELQEGETAAIQALQLIGNN